LRIQKCEVYNDGRYDGNFDTPYYVCVKKAMDECTADLNALAMSKGREIEVFPHIVDACTYNTTLGFFVGNDVEAGVNGTELFIMDNFNLTSTLTYYFTDA
jgi:hypothetical protein